MNIRPFRPTDLDAVVRMWNVTKRDAYPYLPLEQTRTIPEDTSFFTKHLVPRCDIWVALADVDDDVLGFLALEAVAAQPENGYLDRLYVHPDRQRQGVGAALLEVAFATYPGGLRLHTHQANRSARAFYEKHGFTAIAFGVSPPPESAPDVEYAWRPE